MRYSFNSMSARLLLLVMTAVISIWIGLVHSNAYPNMTEQKNLANRNEQMNDAFSRSDLVVVGTVKAVRNYAPTDGGYGYDIAVSEVIKGNAIAQCSVRIGGWTSAIRFAPEEKVLLFLKPSNISFIKERFAIAHDAHQKPLAFRVVGDRISTVAPNVSSEWDGRSLQEIKKILQEN